MKAVLRSCKPYWCYFIIKGLKTDEVCKNKPMTGRERRSKMLRIKADRMNELEKFGFEDWGKYYALNPNVYSNSPLKGLFTCRNVFVDKDTRNFRCGFINYEAEAVFNALIKADMVEEVL